MLLGLIIENVGGRPLVDLLRDGVLSGEGLERLIFQPDEAPTEPIAMPNAQSADELEVSGGYLPSLAGASAAYAAGAMASDAASLARWWSTLCSGEIVSPTSLSEMTRFHDGYGLGLSDDSDPAVGAIVGHGGLHIGFVAYAGCLLDDGSVIVALSNRDDAEIGDVALALAAAAGSD